MQIPAAAAAGIQHNVASLISSFHDLIGQVNIRRPDYFNY
jgi:hypothetical protein